MQQPRDFSLDGARRSRARQAAAQRRQQATRAAASGAGAPASSSGDGGDSPRQDGDAYIFDVTEQTFNEDVALRSRTVPVIVDLWAEWCGPCKQLSPVLERLAIEAGGAWVLAKVDVDANPRLAQMFQAQSIPMVVAVIGGQMVDGFLGAMPESQVRQWLTQVLAVAEQIGLAAADGAPGPGTADARARPTMRTTTCRRIYGRHGRRWRTASSTPQPPSWRRPSPRFPATGAAKSWLAQVNVMRRVSGYEDATAILSEAAQRPDDLEAQIKAADLEIAAGRAEDAFARLLDVVKLTSGDVRNKARVHLIDLFEIFPPGDPAVKAARARLSSLLF